MVVDPQREIDKAIDTDIDFEEHELELIQVALTLAEELESE